MPSTKELILSLLAAITVAVMFWLWRGVIPLMIAGEMQGYFRFLWPMLCLEVGAILFFLGGVFVSDRKLFLALLLTAVVSPFFFLEATPVIIGALLASVFFLGFAAIRLREEFMHSIGFSVSKIAKSGLPSFFTVSSLIIAALYLGALHGNEARALSDFFPRSAFNFVMERASGPIADAVGIPMLNPNTTINEIIYELVRQQLQDRGIRPDALSNYELTQLEKIQLGQFTKQYGLQLSGKEKFSDIFYNQTGDRIADLLGPYRIYLPVVSAIAFFLAFKTLTLPLYYLTLAGLYVLIRILVGVKILKQERVQLEVEKLTL